MDFAHLQLREEKRPYESLGSRAHKSEREFMDFVIDGQSLWELCKIEGLDNISCIWLPRVDEAAVKRLLLLEPADFPEGRVSLYVCAECGDIGCGAVSVRIAMDGDSVTWCDFAYQNNYDDSMTHSLGSFADIDPVSFEKNEYHNLLTPFIDTDHR